MHNEWEDRCTNIEKVHHEGDVPDKRAITGEGGGGL